MKRRELIVSMAAVWLARAARAERDALHTIDELSRALKHREIAQTDWQTGVERAARTLDLADLCKRAKVPFAAKGVNAEVIQLLPGQRFTPKIFAIDKGRAIIPHGHVNMVSHHLVLEGELHGRHYQRVRDEKDALILRPTIDRAFAPGDSSSISDRRDNVHWFVATKPSYTLDCIVDDLDPARGFRYHIDFVDPDKATADAEGLRMPRLSLDECLRRYG